jgi:hypothetical protein
METRMMRQHTIVAIGLALAGLAVAPSLPAQTDEPVAPAAAPAATVTPPSRGASMAQVERQFGAPAERVAPVGQPPITRWVYPGMVVFFEYDHVVHAVVRR